MACEGQISMSYVTHLVLANSVEGRYDADIS